MTTSRIRVFPDSCLRKICTPVRSFDGELKELVMHLRQIMQNQKMGIGIAAPQIGVLRQVALVNVSVRVEKAQELVLINPVIRWMAGENLSHEGCMSLPEYTGYVQRAARVGIRYQDLSGNSVDYEAEGLEAVCIQHELDHLQGKLFFDRVVTLKTDMHPRHWKKKTRR